MANSERKDIIENVVNRSAEAAVIVGEVIRPIFENLRKTGGRVMVKEIVNFRKNYGN